MSEEPDAATTETSAPGRWSRVLPSWARRRPLLTGLAAGILAAAVITGVVFVIIRLSAPQPRYASLPRQSCALVSPADVARYLPGAKGTPYSTGQSSTVKVGVCKWSATSRGEDRTLVAEAFVFRSASSVSQAQKAYRTAAATLRCHCPGVTVSAKPVAGLGDQATEAFVAAGPDADFSKAPNASGPGASLIVLSSNAVIGLTLDTSVAATGESATSPPSSAELTGMISMARDALAALGRPASAPAPATASLAAEPHYAGRPDPCRMVSTATLARYIPGSVFSAPLGGPAMSPEASTAGECSWSSADFAGFMTFYTYRDAITAGRVFEGKAGAQSSGMAGVAGMRWVNSLGEAAQATVRNQDGKASVDLVVWSGNAELDYTYNDLRPGSAARSDRARLLAAVIAMARDGLAALADPALAAFPRGISYASPRHPCQLVKPSTLARYAAGATGQQLSDSGTSGDRTCAWDPDDGNLFLAVSVSPTIDDAQSSYQFDLQFARKDSIAKFNGSQPVKGLGTQATAIFHTDPAGEAGVELDVWSGNAVIEMTFDGSSILGPGPSRAVMLAADIALARDALASLKRA